MASSAARLRLPALLLCLAALAGVSCARKCAASVPELPCGGFSGIVFARDGGAAQRVSNLSAWRALSVPADGTLSLAVCNVGNHRVHDVTLRNVSLVPTVVRGVGARARVRVAVRNSGNLDASGRLVLGSVLPEGRVRRRRLRRRMPPPDTAIVASLVDGVVRADAHVRVDVAHSGNVRLRKGLRDLHIGRATLLGEVVNARAPRGAKCWEYACVEVSLRDAGNVRGVDGQAGVFIRDGQLDDETLDAGCLGRDTYVTVRKDEVANVENVRELHVYDGELSDEAVDAGNMQGAIVRVQMRGVGNVRGAGKVRIVDGELVDEVVDAKHVLNSFVEVVAEDVGNVRARSLFVQEGELVDEAVDVAALFDSDVAVRFTNVGNVDVSGFLIIVEGELVDEAVDALYARNTNFDIALRRVGNVQAGLLTVLSGELVDEVLDLWSLKGGETRIRLRDVANVDVRGEIKIRNGELLDETVDVGRVQEAKIWVTLEQVGNAVANKTDIRVGELVDEVLDSTTVTGGLLKLRLSGVANVQCRPGATLKIVNGQLLETVADVSGRVDGTKAKVVVNNSGGANLPESSISIVNGTLSKPTVEVDIGKPGIEVTVFEGKNASCGSSKA